MNRTEQSVLLLHGKWQVKKLTLIGKSQSFLTEQDFLLTPVKALSIPCTMEQVKQQFFNFCPFPLLFCITALNKSSLGSCLQPHYTLNSEHMRGSKEIFRVNTGSIYDKNISYRKFNSSLVILSGSNSRRKVWVRKFSFSSPPPSSIYMLTS